MSDSRIISVLGSGLNFVKTITPPALTTSVGALAHYGKELARNISDETLKNATKDMFAYVSSSVNLISVLGCEAEGLYMLIQAWPHLSGKERAALSLLLAGSAALYVYPGITFGSEKQILIDYALSTASVFAAKGTTVYAEHAVDKAVRSQYSSL